MRDALRSSFIRSFRDSSPRKEKAGWPSQAGVRHLQLRELPGPSYKHSTRIRARWPASTSRKIRVLASVVTLLCETLDFDESTCYEVADADAIPEVPIAGDWWCTVAGGDGQFDPGNQDPSQCSEETEVIVTAYTRIATDRTDHDENLLHDPDRGCLEMKRQLLKTLVGA